MMDLRARLLYKSSVLPVEGRPYVLRLQLSNYEIVQPKLAFKITVARRTPCFYPISDIYLFS